MPPVVSGRAIADAHPARPIGRAAMVVVDASDPAVAHIARVAVTALPRKRLTRNSASSNVRFVADVAVNFAHQQFVTTDVHRLTQHTARGYDELRVGTRNLLQ